MGLDMRGLLRAVCGLCETVGLPKLAHANGIMEQWFDIRRQRLLSFGLVTSSTHNK